MLRRIDHVVLTAANMESSLAFYRALGFAAREETGRWALFAGEFRLNLHPLGRELEPHAGAVLPGSADLCFETDKPLEETLAALREAGLAPETGIVERRGTRGPMRSFYLRDPDGNLIELCSYLPAREEASV